MKVAEWAAGREVKLEETDVLRTSLLVLAVNIICSKRSLWVRVVKISLGDRFSVTAVDWLLIDGKMIEK